jgi:hypothetical protein
MQTQQYSDEALCTQSIPKKGNFNCVKHKCLSQMSFPA